MFSDVSLHKKRCFCIRVKVCKDSYSELPTVKIKLLTHSCLPNIMQVWDEVTNGANSE